MGQAGERRALPRWWIVGHPVFALAVLVLAMNDRVLKERFPGLITGKLSDVAGVAVVAMLFAAITRRVGVSAAAVAAGFIGLKTVPGVAELLAPLLGGVTRRDSTDLLALGVLWPIIGWLAGDHRERREGARLVACASGVMAAMMAVGATSCAPPDEIKGFVVEGAALYVRLPDEVTVTSLGPNDVRSSWARSDDGGETWQATAPPATPESRGSQACLTDGTCYRVIPDERVEVRAAGGAWSTSFTYTTEQLSRLRARDGCVGLSSFEHLTVVDPGDGEKVVVAMGAEGVLVGRDGDWTRTGVLLYQPHAYGLPTSTRWFLIVPFLGVPASLLLLLFGHRDGRKAWIGMLVALVGNMILAPVAFFAALGDGRAAGIQTALASLALLSIGVALAQKRWVRRPETGRPSGT